MGKEILIFATMIAVALIASTVNAQTKIYRHIDVDGRITYANKPMRGANKLQIDTHPIKTTPVTIPHAISTVVHSQIQKERDIKRRQILESELVLETKLLTTARQKLKQIKNNFGSNVLPSKHLSDDHIKEIKQAQIKMSLHERNIGALNKELANM